MSVPCEKLADGYQFQECRLQIVYIFSDSGIVESSVKILFLLRFAGERAVVAV